MMDKKTKIKDLRQFGTVLGIILGIIGGIHLLKGHASAYPWFFGCGSISLILAVFVPAALRPVFFVFTKITHAIGWFNTRVILILVYYLILTPISIFVRIFRKDLLDRKVDRDAGSYWINRESSIVTLESLEKQF